MTSTRVEKRSARIKVNFLGRDIDRIEQLLHLCRVLGDIEKEPENIITSDESPKIYSLVLRIDPSKKEQIKDVLLNQWPVQSISTCRNS